MGPKDADLSIWKVRMIKLGSKYKLLDTPRILKYKQIVLKYSLSTIRY